MSLVEYARNELKLLRKDDEEDRLQDLVDKCVLDIVQIFSDQGHSGSSAPYVLGILEKVLRWEPITPLTGEDDEWNDVSEYSDKVYFQNKRCSRVFKDETGAYDIQGKVFVEADGCAYTSRDSRVYITFPYTPKTEYVNV